MAKENESSSIEHRGVIQSVSSSTIKVNLLNVAACSSCHAKAACSVSEVDNKVIEILNTGGNFIKGEHVRVLYEKTLGPKALLLGYLLPFFVVFATLMISWIISGNEVLSGLLSLASLIPYYAGLALFRNKLKKVFRFKITRD